MEEKYRIHAFYILFILSSIIVALVTVNWGTIPRLPELITFALTVTSLVLALLAIVYAYVSNSSFYRTIGELTSAATEVMASAADVRDATDKLNSSISPLPILITHVSQRVEETNALVREYSAKQISTAVIPSKDAGPDKDSIEHSLTTSSLYGLFALYLVEQAFSHNKTIDLNKIGEELAIAPMYLHGYVVATSAMGLFQLLGGIGDLKPTQINEDFRRMIGDHLLKCINAMKDETRRAVFLGKIETAKRLTSADVKGA